MELETAQQKTPLQNIICVAEIKEGELRLLS
jgi:hypothetical protein